MVRVCGVYLPDGLNVMKTLLFSGGVARLLGRVWSRYGFEVRVVLALQFLVVVSGCTAPKSERGESSSRVPPVVAPPVVAPRASSSADPAIPGYLAGLEKLDSAYERSGHRIVPLPPADLVALRAYPRLDASAKGVPVGPAQERLTLTTAKTTYAPGEDIRILHVHEVGGPGLELYVMGPKTVYGEYVDGKLYSLHATQPPEPYDGLVLPSPGVDTNFDTTVYRLPPGEHTIVWRASMLSSSTVLTSNTLTIEVR